MQVGAGYIGRFVIPVDATLLSGQIIRGGYPLTTADGVCVVDSNQLITRVQVAVQYRSVQMVCGDGVCGVVDIVGVGCLCGPTGCQHIQ